MGHHATLDNLRQVLTQEASIPALRASLLLFGILAAFAWARRRPFLALLAVSVGGLLGLGYWLVQIVSPLGMATESGLSREWAQAGVNAWAEPKGLGFVWGSEPGFSLLSSLASAGASAAAHAAHRAPVPGLRARGGRR